MYGFTDVIVPSERERQVTYTATDMRSRQMLADPFCSVDKIDSVVIVLGDTRSDGQYVGIKNDVLRIIM